MIPAHTRRAHLPARDPRCDTVTVLNMAALRRCMADMNAVAGLEADWNLHYASSMGDNHFNYIIDRKTRRRRPASRAEKARRPQDLSNAEMRRYRKKVRRGRYVRPFTVAERNRQAKRRRVRICWEIKSRLYGARPELAVRFVKAITATGWASYYMTLVTMHAWGAKLRNFKLAGGETALLPHDARKTPAIQAGLNVYQAQYIDRIWGRWA